MSAVKTLTLGLVAWAAWASIGAAAPVVFGENWSWTSYGAAGNDPNLVSNAGNFGVPLSSMIPDPSQAPAPVPAPAAPAPPPPPPPVPAPAPAAEALAAPSGMVDAFLNFGTGPFAESSVLTDGNAQSWATSPQVAQLFGGAPNAQQQQAFVNTVAQRVEQTFQLSGVPLTISTDPSIPAAHVLSIVSGATSHFTPGAIGETDIGRNGFSFIDQVAQSAQNVDQLEWILAHNIAHELMLAFGVPEIHDQSGNYIDSTRANIGMMLSPNAVFSQGAAQDLLSKNFLSSVPMNGVAQPQLIDAQPVPEPATWAAWTLAAAAGLVIARRRRRAA